ncbi:MAG: bifunctional (p)ppGpp synthetase/guanosine-3',5'-bis(diphosphate) 3'-pyrophosphohydrolase [Actinobacteria bacterium]|nr:bifunctional (p)ppGpp synthetase/guanosine-3',5'-bis(diphosphate) 3'-pyrophosphohydrolase [Actinomycetota bacterium]
MELASKKINENNTDVATVRTKGVGSEVDSDLLYEELVKKIEASSLQVDLELLKKAYLIAKKYHDGQCRKSGEPFIVHPLEVAKILADIEMDQTSIIAALLHDLVEDTEYSLEKINKEFGSEIANIINGVTKLDKIVFTSKEEQQVENLRKMIIAMAEDVRIILVKLADRLHNMRTLSPFNKEKRKIKALETLQIYAPIAHRLGIFQIKSELEDLSFKYLYPKQYEKIVEMVRTRLEERKSLIDETIKTVDEKLKEVGIQAEITGRIKNYYSIYNKMVNQNREFEDIYDLIAIRIIVNDVKSCYGALGIVHSIWRPLPGRFRDFIANPKLNMYQSLHTTVIGNKGKPLEIQIRTFEMHRVAEYGIAAHYRYKEGSKVDEFDKRVAWIRQILDWQRELKDPQDYMESLKLDLFEDEVFVFTPKGKVINLPRGSTPIDFAYAIHTDIGHNCIGAKVNGQMVPIESVLENGDIVEIIVSKSPKGPSRDWLNVVKTSRARNKIKQWFSKEERQESYNVGREIMLKLLRKNGLSFKSVPLEIFEEVAKDMNFEKADVLFQNIGSHKVSPHQVFTKLIKKLSQSEEKQEGEKSDIALKETYERPPLERRSGTGIKVRGMEGVLVNIARCCNPVPEDRIIGYITRGRGITVHRADCSNIVNLNNIDKQRLIEVAWDRGVPFKFNVEIQVEAIDRVRLLRDITNVIGEYDINIVSAQALSLHKNGHAKFRFVIEVNNMYVLKDILRNIKQVDSVYDAFRVLPRK